MELLEQSLISRLVSIGNIVCPNQGLTNTKHSTNQQLLDSFLQTIILN
jgi:hypothetical protein